MNINHRVAPIPHVPKHTSKPSKPQNQQTQGKPKVVTNPAPFLKFLEQWFKPEKKGEIQNAN